MHVFLEVFHLSVQAEALFDLKRYDQAAERYGKALTLDPDYSPALGGLAACYLYVNQPEEARPLVQRRLALQPDDAYAHYQMALVLSNTGQRAQAIEFINKALGYDSKADYFALKANIHYQAGHFFEARRFATEGLLREPQHLECLKVRVAALYDERKPLRYEAQALLNLAPESAWAHVFRGYAHLFDDEIAAALERFREALRLDPTLTQAHSGREAATDAYYQSWGERLQRIMKNAGRSSHWAFNVIPVLGPTIFFFLLITLFVTSSSGVWVTGGWLAALVLFVTTSLILLREKQR